jgi:deoxycytidylate deaminase
MDDPALTTTTCDRRIDRYIKIATKAAMKSQHHQHRLGSVLIRGSNVISTGHNFSTVHSEHDCINRAFKSGTEGTIIIVVRVRRNGTMGMSRPCVCCLGRLINAGVERVIYTTNDGEYRMLKLNSIEVQAQVSLKLQLIMWHKKGNNP